MVALMVLLKLHNPQTPVLDGLKAIDWLGSVTIIGATAMLMLGLELGGVKYPWSSPTVICLITFGLLTVGLFALIEWKVAKFPVVPMHLFRNRASLAPLVVCGFHAFVFMSGHYYLPLYFQAVLGASPLMCGVYVLPYVVSMSLASAGIGILIQRKGTYLGYIILGMAIMTTGFGFFIDFEARPDWGKIILYQLIAGIGAGPNIQAPLIALQAAVEGRDMAAATAMFGFVRHMFTSISITFGGVVFQNAMQDQHPRLIAELGQETAELLSGAQAAASVGLIAQLPEAQGEVARMAYLRSLRIMWVMYVLWAGAGLLSSFLVAPRELSEQHEEHKTGLDSTA